MSPEDFLLYHGYYSEMHTVDTPDGYSLTLQRLPCRKGKVPSPEVSSKSSSKPVALFVHGIIMNGVSWLFNQEENVLAYALLERGFEVWLFNARGSELSRKHAKHSPKERAFWKFSLDEMGANDVPAAIHYVLEKTGEESLIYVGHSMGCALLHVAASVHGDLLVPKIKLMIAFAPAVYLTKARTPFVKLAAKIPTKAILSPYHGELFLRPTTKLLRILAPWVSSNLRASSWLWWQVTGLVCGKDDDSVVWPMVPVAAAHLPSVTSVRTYAHFLQMHKSGSFRAYDWGRRGNLKKYGEREPPVYDLAKSTFPIGLFYGENDACIPPEDVKRLVKELPNVALLHRVEAPKFNHVEFFSAKEAKSLVNDHVLTLIEEFVPCKKEGAK